MYVLHIYFIISDRGCFALDLNVIVQVKFGQNVVIVKFGVHCEFVDNLYHMLVFLQKLHVFITN